MLLTIVKNNKADKLCSVGNGSQCLRVGVNLGLLFSRLINDNSGLKVQLALQFSLK